MQVLGLVGGEGFICRRCCEAVCDGLELDRSLSYDRSCTIIQSYPAYGKPMPTEPYSYELIVQHPRLLALYGGWLGQKIYSLTHSAVTWDRLEHWSAAAPEMDRLVLVLHEAEKAKVLNLSDETKAALGKLIGCFAAGGWWTSKDGTRERAACQQKRRERDEFTGDEPDLGNAPFQPRLLLERDSVYLVAPTVINQLDGVLMQTAIAMDNLDLCRLGVLLSGFCYRSTPQLGNTFINSVLNNLTARGVTDLQAENEFRRAVGLSEVNEDRRPRALTDSLSLQPLVLEDITAARDSQDPCALYIGDMTDQRCLVLGCVFRRFDVVVPPAECDASQYSELAGLKKKLQVASVKATQSVGKTKLTEESRLWTEEAIEYLGLDRCGLKRPELALQRFITEGVLRPIKVGRRNAFTKAELDRILSKGGHVRRQGRPRKQGN